MRKMLEYQADRIEAVLARHKVPGRVAGGTLTPRWVRFKVFPALGSRISRIKGLSEEFAAAVDAPSCRVARKGSAVVVEIPREDTEGVRLIPMLRDVHDLPSVTALLGLAEDGTPLFIRLPSPDVAHVLVSGTTGSGKTALLRTMVLSMAMRHARDDELSLVLVDPKGGRALGCLGGLSQLARPVIVSIEEAVEALQSLVRLMEQRDLSAQNRPAVVVVIDELADLMMVGGAEPERLLTRLVQRGREAGIHIVAATQKPSAAVIGGLIKSNFPVRLVGKVTSAQDAQTASGWPGTGAERLLGKGDFLAVAAGTLYRFQAAYATDAQIGEIVNAVLEGNMPRLACAGTDTDAYEFEPLEL